MKFKLKGSELLKLGDLPNSHQVSLRAGISAPTVYKYLSEDSYQVEVLDLRVFATLLVEGLGIPPEKVMKLKLEDVFELQDD